MLRDILLVMLGSGFGGALRYCAGRLGALWLSAASLFWVTLAINVVGSLSIGAILGSSIGNSHPLRLLFAIGLCGGFTTFSSFSLESLSLLRSGQISTALLYIAASVVLSIVAVWIGYRLTVNG